MILSGVARSPFRAQRRASCAGADATPPTAPTPDPERLPEPVIVDTAAPAVDLWRTKAELVATETYAGISLVKFPEDLRVYEHILWSKRIDTVVELGTYAGGSLLWFRDRMRTFAGYGRSKPPTVIGATLSASHPRALLEAVDPSWQDEISLLEGDVCDPGLAARVSELVPPGARCLVVEDTAHTYDTSLAALNLYSDLVPPGGIFVVEDGCVDVEELRIDPDWPRGVLRAIDEWLATPQGSNFRRRPELELYGVTCHVQGYLERVS